MLSWAFCRFELRTSTFHVCSLGRVSFVLTIQRYDILKCRWCSLVVFGGLWWLLVIIAAYCWLCLVNNCQLACIIQNYFVTWLRRATISLGYKIKAFLFVYLSLFSYLCSMKAMYKNELANAAGVSCNTFRRWLSGKRSKLAELGARSRSQLLPPRAVAWVCREYGIDL